jgi:hypothetical protein
VSVLTLRIEGFSISLIPAIIPAAIPAKRKARYFQILEK